MSSGLGVDPESVVLGLSFDFHDAAAALLIDGNIVAAAEQERFSRIKHDASLPVDATRACLASAGITAQDVGHVVFYEKPLAAASRFLATKQCQGPRSAGSFFRDAPRVFGTHLMAGYRISAMLRDLGASKPPMTQFVEHHLSHAASAYYASPFDHAGVLTVDGLGEWATATVGLGSDRHLSLIEELRFPDSVGLVYSLVTSWCGFRPNDDEYKLMGLAPYGEPRFTGELEELAVPMGDGSIRVEASRLGWFNPHKRSTDRLAEQLGGPPRMPEDPIGQREADLAASVQQLTERTVLQMARRVHERTGQARLCMAGGVALNCVANGRLLTEGPFEEIWVQPAAGDAGGALGAALAFWHLELGAERCPSGARDAMSGAFLGPDLSDEEIESALVAHGIASSSVDGGDLHDVVARRVAAGDVVGWCRGRMEFGPRALGHRSLLADPRSPTVRQRLNAVTKGREGFRPFAPAVLEDRAGEWFELDQPSPYMLMVARVRDRHLVSVDTEPAEIAARAEVTRSSIPACTHVDGSARIQTVGADTNPDMHELLKRFEVHAGVPLLVNTSFNRAGEPIVATAEDAITSAAAGRVDLLVLGDHLVEGSELSRVGPCQVPSGPNSQRSAHRDPGGGAHSDVDRLAMAWGAAVVPLALQLVRVGVVGGGELLAAGVFAIAALLAGRERSGWAAACAAVAGAWVAFVPQNAGYFALLVGAVLLSGTATGYLPLRRRTGTTTRWESSATVLPALPLLAADLLLLSRPGLVVPGILLLAGSMLLVVSLVFPSGWSWAERASAPLTRAAARVVQVVTGVVERIMRSVARVIGVPLTALAFFLAVLVPWLLQRVTFSDPLAAPHNSGTRWIERSAALEVRSDDLWFADPGPRRSLMERPGVRFVGIGLLAVLVVYGAMRMAPGAGRLVGLGDGDAPPPELSKANADMVAEPWYPEWNAAYGELWERGWISQYAGIEYGEVESPYLRFSNGVRRSWRAPAGRCTAPIDVWMFGGSTMFGVGQRDDHTVASEVARMAWGEGYDLEVSNRAIPGDVAWIEQRRLERALARGAQPPDMVVFYDGYNDLRAQEWAFMAGSDTEGRLLSLNDRDLMPVLKDLVEEERDGKRVVVADAVDINARPVDEPAEMQIVADGASFQYDVADGWSQAFLEARGIPVQRFFQPWVSTRDPVVSGDFPSSPISRSMSDRMRQRLPEGTVDLADVLDGDMTPYYTDDVHTNEAANVVIAAAMWESLRPQIQDLAAQKGIQPCP